MKTILTAIIFLGIFLVNFSVEASQGVVMKISSSAFLDNHPIPAKFTCDGDNMSPPLAWQGEPSNTQSFVLIVDDPDAPRGTWDHWVLFNIPAKINQLAENITVLPPGTLAGKNSWNTLNYGGPCPPSGEHRYFFKLYALDTTLSLQAGATKAEILNEMQHHILAQAQLLGIYKRFSS